MAAYKDLADLAGDPIYLARVSHAIVKFANYILAEAPSTGNHTVRYKWAVNAIQNPTVLAAAVAPTTTLDTNVDYGLGAVLDADLQTAVENVCNQLMFS